MTNERAADLRHLYLPALVGNAGTGAVTQVQAIRGLCRVNWYRPLLIDSAKRRRSCDTPVGSPSMWPVRRPDGAPDDARMYPY